MQRSSDKAHSILHEAGWSVGDVALADPETGKKTWLVYCHRNSIEIVGKASTQDGAWIDAVRLAENIENGVTSTDEYSDFLEYLHAVPWHAPTPEPGADQQQNTRGHK